MTSFLLVCVLARSLSPLPLSVFLINMSADSSISSISNTSDLMINVALEGIMSAIRAAELSAGEVNFFQHVADMITKQIHDPYSTSSDSQNLALFRYGCLKCHNSNPDCPVNQLLTKRLDGGMKRVPIGKQCGRDMQICDMHTYSRGGVKSFRTLPLSTLMENLGPFTSHPNMMATSKQRGRRANGYNDHDNDSDQDDGPIPASTTKKRLRKILRERKKKQQQQRQKDSSPSLPSDPAMHKKLNLSSAQMHEQSSLVYKGNCIAYISHIRSLYTMTADSRRATFLYYFLETTVWKTRPLAEYNMTELTQIVVGGSATMWEMICAGLYKEESEETRMMDKMVVAMYMAKIVRIILLSSLRRSYSPIHNTPFLFTSAEWDTVKESADHFCFPARTVPLPPRLVDYFKGRESWLRSQALTRVCVPHFDLPAGQIPEHCDGFIGRIEFHSADGIISTMMANLVTRGADNAQIGLTHVIGATPYHCRICYCC